MIHISVCSLGRTERRQLILHLQHHPLSDVLQHADDLVVPQFGQVDAVHGLYVVAHVQLVAPADDEKTHLNTIALVMMNDRNDYSELIGEGFNYVFYEF